MSECLCGRESEYGKQLCRWCFNLGELDLKIGASSGQVKSAFKAKAQQYHPDKHHNAGPKKEAEAALKFGQIKAAYDFLNSNPVPPIPEVKTGPEVPREPAQKAEPRPEYPEVKAERTRPWTYERQAGPSIWYRMMAALSYRARSFCYWLLTLPISLWRSFCQNPLRTIFRVVIVWALLPLILIIPVGLLALFVNSFHSHSAFLKRPSPTPRLIYESGNWIEPIPVSAIQKGIEKWAEQRKSALGFQTYGVTGENLVTYSHNQAAVMLTLTWGTGVSGVGGRAMGLVHLQRSSNGWNVKGSIEEIPGQPASP